MKMYTEYSLTKVTWYFHVMKIGFWRQKLEQSTMMSVGLSRSWSFFRFPDCKEWSEFNFN